MAALTNTQISVTYVGLLKTSANTVLSSTAQQITDGSGNNSILYLSTAGVGIGGAAASGKELDVTGNVLVTGDLQVDNINIDGNTISATSGVVTLANGAIATTQSQNDNSTKIATTAYVDAAIDGVDTLAEILAIGNTTGGTDIAVSANDDITFTNSSKAIFGSSQDLQIYNDSSNNYIDSTSNELRIRSNDLRLMNYGSAKYITADSGADVSLYHNDSKKFETTSSGVTITGVAVSDGLDMGDSEQIRLGNSQDLLIFHDGNNSKITESGTGGLYIGSNLLGIQNNDHTEMMAQFTENGAVELYYDNSKKLETTSTGAKVTGSNFNVFAASGATKLEFGQTNGNWKIEAGNSGNNTLIIGSVSNSTDNITLDTTNGGSATFSGDVTVTGQQFITGGSAGETALQVTGQYSGSGTVHILEFQRAGGAVKGDLSYADATTDMELGTATAHSFALKTGDTRALTIDSSQNATFAGTIATSGNITATASNATISAAESGGATTKIMGASVGRVGTSSNHNLEILSNDTAAITIDTSQNATFAGSVDIHATTGDSLLQFNIDGDTYSMGIDNSDSDKFKLAYGVFGSTDLISIDTSGNTTFAGELTANGDLLQVSGAHPELKLNDSDDSNYSLVSYSDGDLLISTNHGNEAGAADTIRFSNNGGTERMRIDGSGNLGLGTTSPTSYNSNADNLVINESGDFSGITLAADNDQGSNIYFADPDDDNVGGITYNHTDNYLNFRVNGAERMRITNAGRLGLSTTSPSHPFHCNGDALISKLGVQSFNASFDLYNNGTTYLNGAVTTGGNLSVTGALSKGSGSFKIEHPVKPDTHYLYHSFVESPLTDLIYRGKAKLVNGKALINIDEHFGMTEGTFEALVDDKQVFTTNEDSWDAVKGKVQGNQLNIECQNKDFNGYVSWLVIGDRKDKHIMEADWTDERGKPKLEILKSK